MVNNAERWSEEPLDSFNSESVDGADTGEPIDLQHYLRILRKFKWPIVLFTAAITALAGYYAYTATPIYQSTAMLLIESDRTNVGTIQELVGIESEDSAYYETQFSLLRSRRLAERVVDRLNLWNNPLFVPPDPESLANASLSSAESGDAVGATSIIDTVKGVFTQRADDSSVELSELSDSSVAVESSDLSNHSYVDSSSTAVLSSTQTDEERSRMIAIGHLMANLTINPIRKTKLVEISFDSSDSVLAAQVANAVGDQYISSYLDAKVEMTNRASTWLTERLAVLKSQLDEAEDRLVEFRRENSLVDVGGSVDRLNEQALLLATGELAQARSELSSAADLYEEVRALRDRPELQQSIVAIQSDPLVQGVKIEQGQRQRELDELLNRYGDKHPRVIDANSRLESLNATLQGHVNRVIGSIEKNYQLLRQRVASIEAKIESGKQDFQSLGSKRFELEALEREVATKRDVYDTFFSRMTEANSAEGLETANARISDYATVSTAPIKPKKQMIIALAALGALVLSMLMAFLYEQLDDTVKSADDIEKKLGVKLLGILPLIRGGVLKGKMSALPLNPENFTDEHRTFVEAVNTARTAICLDDGSDGRKIVTVTSSLPGEGKSTTSINLAFSLGRLERVLLIDCDLRKPTLAKAAGLDKDGPGLTSLIANNASARACIQRGAFGESVDLLPTGPIPDHPLEFLSSSRFEKIVAELGKYYDRIVIDTAPVQAVSDALVLSKMSDAVIYVVKSHDTGFGVVERGLERLGQVKAKIAGVVLTQVDIAKVAAYGGDYYFQGYYDYYGYKDTDDGKRLRLTPGELKQIKNDTADVELDLDYDDRGSQNGSGRFNDAFRDSELDRTTELDVGDRHGLRAGRSGRKTRSENDDSDLNLDIL